jgi:hypothetical protein
MQLEGRWISFMIKKERNWTDRWQAMSDDDDLSEQQASQYPNLDNQYRILS